MRINQSLIYNQPQNRKTNKQITQGLNQKPNYDTVSFNGKGEKIKTAAVLLGLSLVSVVCAIGASVGGTAIKDYRYFSKLSEKVAADLKRAGADNINAQRIKEQLKTAFTDRGVYRDRINRFNLSLNCATDEKLADTTGDGFNDLTVTVDSQCMENNGYPLTDGSDILVYDIINNKWVTTSS